jgi:S-adenosyl methyltransferase
MQPGGFADIDTKTPSGARVYDYMLGGTDNYVVDRIAADQTEMMMPGTKALARNNRRYMERVVRYLAGECGVRQFIGTGIPSASNVHEVAGRVTPDTRVVYVDNDRCKSGCAQVSMLVVGQVV